MPTETLLATLALAALPAALYKAWRRLQLSRAKHPSLAGHSLWAKRIARLVPGYSYTEAEFFAADGAPPEVQACAAPGLPGCRRDCACVHRARWR